MDRPESKAPNRAGLSPADNRQLSGRFHVRKDKTNPRRLAYLALLLFATPPHWSLFAIGLLLVAAAILLHGWTAGYLARAGYTERETLLTVRGPYRYNRNPYYLAHMTMDLGFFLVAGRPLFYFLYFPVIFSVYRRWVINEERFLEQTFGDDYRLMKRDVPRWGVRLKPTPARGPELPFRWATFLVNRELPRSISHLFFLGVFVFYFFFGNPVLHVSVLTRATVLAAVAVWLALRDIYPVDTSRKGFGWVSVALGSAVAVAVFLSKAPVWEPWSGVRAWLAISAGLCLVLLVSAANFTGLRRFLGKADKDLLSRPVCQWYALGLGAGLLSCTLGGVWIGITVPFIIWALDIAGILPLKMLPQRPGHSLGLLLLSVLST